MNQAVVSSFIGYFLVLCRVGVAFASMPALAGPRYPMFVRMLFAIAISAALTPLVLGTGQWKLEDGGSIVYQVIAELMAGFVIGFWSYCFIHAVRFAATYIVNAIGLGGVPGQPLADQEPEGAVSSILSLGFMALILATDLHFATIRALVSSYGLVPMGQLLDLKISLSRSLEILTRTSVISLQMASPFMVLSVVVNFALGIANRLTPQLSVYFAFTGLLTMVSLAVLAAASPTMLLIATDAYRDFLENVLQ